jgi:hypothetical protein
VSSIDEENETLRSRLIFGRLRLRGAGSIAVSFSVSSEQEGSVVSALDESDIIFGTQVGRFAVVCSLTPQRLACCMVEDLQSWISVYSVLRKVSQKQKLPFCPKSDELELDRWSVGPIIGTFKLLTSH